MNQSTTFIVGAGASKEVNLPTGYELKRDIANLLDIRFDHWDQKSGDYVITNALRHLVRTPDGRNGDINPYLHEAWHIRDALPLAISIDNFIDSQRGNENIALCGKLAITRAILEAEQKSLLFFESVRRDSELDYSSLEETWYLPFFQLLTENCEKNDLVERFRSVTLIIFNYDRCIEHFIFNALKKYYGINDQEAAEIVGALNIYHPYGSVGALQWQPGGGGISFGQAARPETLLACSERIRTFTEGTNPEESEILAIRQHMREAKRVVFIGFAFHRLNMQLISPDGYDEGQEPPRCFATTLGISESDKGVIQNQIRNLYKDNLSTQMANVKCSEFFSEFWRSLSFQ